MTRNETNEKLHRLTGELCRALISPLPHDPEVRRWALPMRASWARDLGGHAYKIAREAGRIRPDGTADLTAA